MQNKEQKRVLSVQAIADMHVVLLGMELPEQKCARLLGFALRREDNTEGEKRLLPRYKIVMSVEPSPTSEVLCSTRKPEPRVIHLFPTFLGAQYIW